MVAMLPVGRPADRAGGGLDAAVYRLLVKTSTEGVTARS